MQVPSQSHDLDVPFCSFSIFVDELVLLFRAYYSSVSGRGQ